MFKELLPLITQRPLTITVAVVEEGRIRLNVIPQALKADDEANGKIKHSHRDEITEIPDGAVKALTAPLSLTGTAEEIDAKLPEILTHFTESHVGLQNTFDRARDQIAQAVKAIDERDKNKPKAKTAASKQEQKQEQAKPDSGELLPLWCKEPQGSQGDGAKADGNNADPSSAAAQQTLLPENPEEVSNHGSDSREA
jgi:PRTRC genetic system protein E